MTCNPGIAWLAENERAVRWLLKSWPEHLRDELRGVMVDRAPGIAATFDDTRAVTFSWHMIKNLRWYMWKWVNKRNREMARTPGSLDDAVVTPDASNELELGEEVASAMGRLTAYERYVVVAHAVDGMSFEDLGSMVGKSKATVRTDYLLAISKAKGDV